LNMQKCSTRKKINTVSSKVISYLTVYPIHHTDLGKQIIGEHNHTTQVDW